VLLHKPVPVDVLVQAIHKAMRLPHGSGPGSQYAKNQALNQASNEFDEHG
jgi:hypothetical protein